MFPQWSNLLQITRVFSLRLGFFLLNILLCFFKETLTCTCIKNKYLHMIYSHIFILTLHIYSRSYIQSSAFKPLSKFLIFLCFFHISVQTLFIFHFLILSTAIQMFLSCSYFQHYPIVSTRLVHLKLSLYLMPIYRQI